MAGRTRRSLNSEGGLASANSALIPRSLLRGGSFAIYTSGWDKDKTQTQEINKSKEQTKEQGRRRASEREK